VEEKREKRVERERKSMRDGVCVCVCVYVCVCMWLEVTREQIF